MDPALVALLSGGGGAALAGWAIRRIMAAEIGEMVTGAIEKERILSAGKFATREDFARIEGKIDAVLSAIRSGDHGRA
tara:strand:+ start:773 stop:1006 length:234 start_codon:yes stop_codon:yes gene_type:complete